MKKWMFRHLWISRGVISFCSVLVILRGSQQVAAALGWKHGPLRPDWPPEQLFWGIAFLITGFVSMAYARRLQRLDEHGVGRNAEERRRIASQAIRERAERNFDEAAPSGRGEERHA